MLALLFGIKCKKKKCRRSQIMPKKVLALSVRAYTCVVQKCWNDVTKYSRKVRTAFCNFKFGGEWEDSNREIMKMQGWLEIRKLSENPKQRQISTSSPKPLHWKTRRPWRWGRGLGFRLHADRKSKNGRQREHISRTDEVIFIQLLRFCRISELPVLFSRLPDLRNRGRLNVKW